MVVKRLWRKSPFLGVSLVLSGKARRRDSSGSSSRVPVFLEGAQVRRPEYCERLTRHSRSVAQVKNHQHVTRVKHDLFFQTSQHIKTKNEPQAGGLPMTKAGPLLRRDC